MLVDNGSFLGYSRPTLERKAAKRKMTVGEYEAYLVTKRQTRAVRHRAAVAEKRAAEQAEKQNRVRA